MSFYGFKKMKKRWIVLAIVALAFAWISYHHMQYEAFIKTPTGQDEIARRGSFHLGKPVVSETGRRYFEGFVCSSDCSGHQAGYDWADENPDIEEHYCWSLDAPDSFKEGCAGFVRAMLSSG